MFDNYTRVRLMTDKYQTQGASKGALGYTIEVYPNGEYEIEFSDESGITFAQIVAQENELQRDEPPLSPLPAQKPQTLAGKDATMETVYFNPLTVGEQSRLTRSNKK